MQFEKLAALGAQGVAGGTVAGWLAFVYLIRPVASGGMDARGWFAGSAAAFVVFALIAAAHAWFGAQLKKGPDSILG
jgi:uncharacterized membrane protein